MIRALSIAGITVLLGLAAALLWADSAVVPSSQLESKESFAVTPASTTRDTFTLATYNLERLSGGGPDATPTARLEQALRLIEQIDPEVLGLQEVSLGRSQFGPPSPLDSIATRLDYTATARAVRRNDRFLPFPLSNPGASVSGQAVLSRYPLRRNVRRRIDTSAAQRDWSLFRPDPVVQVTAVGIGGWPLIVVNVNIDAPSVSVREQQARAVNRLYRQIAQQGLPAVVIGSINSPVQSAVRTAPSGDDTMKLLTQGTDLSPALSPESARITGRSVSTYPAGNPTRKVDYIFYRPQFILPIEARTWCESAASPPSNHCPVSLSFFLPRPLDKLSKGPIPDAAVPSLDSLLAL